MSIKYLVQSSFVAIVCWTLVSAYDVSKDTVQYVVNTSHLDTQWQWPLDSTIANYLPATIRGNIALFKKYPGYVFNFEGAYRYMLAKKFYPSLYDSLKKIYIPSGNWRVAGSMVEACDVNIPSPEALIRQILYGNGFFNDEFGKRSTDIFLPDCFGFGYALPTIAVHCGLTGFSTQKLEWWSGRPIPFDIGTWQGVDGSSIIAAINPGSYSRGWGIKTDAIKKLGQTSNIYTAYGYCGVGDTGGAKDDSTVAALMARVAQNNSQSVKVVCTASDQMFKDLSAKQIARLPKYTGELLMKTHGTGCYTHHSDIKERNHINEQSAFTAENLSALAELSGGVEYPKAQLKNSWIRFLAHQFHDDVTGTSVNSAYDITRRNQDSSINDFQSIITRARQSIADNMDTRFSNKQSIPVVVVNPLSIERTDVARTTCTFADKMPRAIRVFNADGNEVASQIISRSSEQKSITLVFETTVPSLGCRVYEVRPAPSPFSQSNNVKVSARLLENSTYRVTIDKNGDVASIVDKRAKNRELLAEPSRMELRNDITCHTGRDCANWDNFPQWEILWETAQAKPVGFVDDSVTIRVIEQGPVRASVEVSRTKFGSRYVQTYSLSGDILRVDTRIDWRSKGYLLKTTFPLTAHDSLATFDLGIGVIGRPTMNASQYEVPAQHWADITTTDKSFGVSVITDCKRGWDKADDHTLRLTCVHSPADTNYQNQGDLMTHTYAYGIYGHAGDWRKGNSVAQAARFNQPLIAVQTTQHSGTVGRIFSGLKHSEGCTIMAIKKSEKTDEYIVRVRETNGVGQPSAICSFGFPVVTAREVNGQEDSVGTVACDKTGIRFSLRPFQPRAFAIAFGK